MIFFHRTTAFGHTMYFSRIRRNGFRRNGKTPPWHLVYQTSLYNYESVILYLLMFVKYVCMLLNCALFDLLHYVGDGNCFYVFSLCPGTSKKKAKHNAAISLLNQMGVLPALVNGQSSDADV